MENTLAQPYKKDAEFAPIESCALRNYRLCDTCENLTCLRQTDKFIESRFVGRTRFG